MKPRNTFISIGLSKLSKTSVVVLYPSSEQRSSPKWSASLRPVSPTFLQKNFLDFLVLWVVSKDLGPFLRAFSPVMSFRVPECSFTANPLGSFSAGGNDTARISSPLKE